MIARRKSPRSSALSNPSGGGRCSPPNNPKVRGVAGGVGTGGARWRKVGFGLVCHGKAGVARHGSVRCGTEWLGKAGEDRHG